MIVKREAAPEDVDATDARTNHRIFPRSEVAFLSFIRFERLNRVAGLQSVERPAGLHRCVKIGR